MGASRPSAALETLAQAPYVETPHGRIDVHRALRQGLPEVIYGAAKTARQIVEAMRVLAAHGQPVLATRVAAEVAERGARGAARVPSTSPTRACSVPRRRRVPNGRGSGSVLVVCAGTADLPVAREAFEVARRFGNKVELLVDVGVAGLHRLLGLARAAARGARVDRGCGHGGRAAVGGRRARRPRR